VLATSQEKQKEKIALDQILISRILQLNFKPEVAYFFVNWQGDNILSSNLDKLHSNFIVIDNQNDRSTFDEPPLHKIIFGAAIKPPSTAKSASFHILALAKEGMLGWEKIYLSDNLKVDELIRMDGLADNIRQRLSKSRQEMKNLELQFKTQAKSLDRLREDASLIGNFAKILDIRQQALLSKKERDNLLRDTQLLQKALQATRGAPLPRDYKIWEADLTSQVDLLAQAAKLAELNERSLKAKAARELNENLRLIESVRREDIDQLRKELESFRYNEENLQ
jgi:hypothetical protein